MADSTKSAKKEAKKDSFWKSVKTEFKKIAWPETVKQSVAVLCVSVAVGLIITFLDTIIQYGINFLTSIGV